MAKIVLVKNTGKIKQVLLDANEICPVENCCHTQDCRGKKNNRDNDFICNLRELILLHKKASRRIIK